MNLAPFLYNYVSKKKDSNKANAELRLFIFVVNTLIIFLPPSFLPFNKRFEL